MAQSDIKPNKVYIYTRVSGDRQVTEGDGLVSQATRCHRYAEQHGLVVDKVYQEEGLSGALRLQDRPQLLALCQQIERQKPPCVVIVDDISRFARDMGVYMEFRLHIRNCGAILMAPNMKFGDSPEDQVFENISMAFAQYHRQANARQVKNRQKARLENGYWPFYAPLGYRHEKDVGHGGKVLVRVEPMAAVIGEAFAGFAAGRFETVLDVANFFARSGVFPLGKKGKFHPSSAKGVLTNPLYTGFIAYPAWEVSLRPGRHSPITDMRTFQKVQERFGIKAKAPYRKDLREDFPLRGFVLCASCNDPLTASWSKARNGTKHAYYHCKRRGCVLYGKSIRRANVDDRLAELLQRIAPSKPMLALAEEIIRDTHRRLRSEHTALVKRLGRQIEEIEREKQMLIGRLLKTEDPAMIRLYENHVKTLEEKHAALTEEAGLANDVDTGLDSSLGTVFEFLSNPYSMWEDGDLEDKRTVLKMAFAKKLPFDKKDGFGTALTSLPFTVFSSLETKEKAMVGQGRWFWALVGSAVNSTKAQGIILNRDKLKGPDGILWLSSSRASFMVEKRNNPLTVP